MMPLKRILPLLLSLCSLPAMAEPAADTAPLDPRPWYRLEVIIFAQSNRSDALQSERWPDDYVQAELPAGEQPFAEPPRQGAESVVVVRGLDVPAGADGFSSPAPAMSEPVPPVSETALPEEFSWLSEEELLLGEPVERLRKSTSMELLWHGGWIQPGLEREAALPVTIVLPREEPALDENGQPLPYTPPPQLEGQLRLVLSRYLHFETDLGYLLAVDPARIARVQGGDDGVVEEKPTAVYGDGEMSEEMTALALATLSEEERQDLLRQAQLGERPTWQVFHLRDSRRMRSGEVHYLDHPLFGLVVQALPLEMSPADAEAAEKAQAAMDAQRLLEESEGDEVVTPATLTAPR